MRTLVVIPTYEEALNITEVLTRVRAGGAPTSTCSWSTTTAPTAPPTSPGPPATELGQIDVLVRPKKDGLGNAYRHGFREGMDRGYDVLVQMDADLSHDPAALPVAASPPSTTAPRPSSARATCPGGSVPHWPWYRRALSKWGNRYACFVLGMTVHDATAGFRAYRVDALQGDRRVHHPRARATGSRSRPPTASPAPAAGSPRCPITFTDRVRGVLEDVAPRDERGAPPRHLVGHPRPHPVAGRPALRR